MRFTENQSQSNSWNWKIWKDWKDLEENIQQKRECHRWNQLRHDIHIRLDVFHWIITLQSGWIETQHIGHLEFANGQRKPNRSLNKLFERTILRRFSKNCELIVTFCVVLGQVWTVLDEQISSDKSHSLTRFRRIRLLYQWNMHLSHEGFLFIEFCCSAVNADHITLTLTLTVRILSSAVWHGHSENVCHDYDYNPEEHPRCHGEVREADQIKSNQIKNKMHSHWFLKVGQYFDRSNTRHLLWLDWQKYEFQMSRDSMFWMISGMQIIGNDHIWILIDIESNWIESIGFGFGFGFTSSGLKWIEIPPSVQFIAGYAFSNLSSLSLQISAKLIHF
jgi:hypothetical protein